MTDFTALSLKDYLDKLASDSPTPGGGSVSAYTAALAMGLSQMVARIALKRKKKANMSPQEQKEDKERRKTIEQILTSLEKTKKDAFEIVNLDPQVFEEVMAVWGDDSKMEDALQNAFRLQADLAFLIVMADEWNTMLAHLVKGSIKNDLLVSAGLYEGSFRGATHTAMINAHYMKDAERKQKAEKALQELKTRFQKEHAGAAG